MPNAISTALGWQAASRLSDLTGPVGVLLAGECLVAMKPQRHQTETPPREEDAAIFRSAVADAIPLRQDNRVSHARPPPRPQPRQRELDEAAVLGESLHGTLDIDDLLELRDIDAFLRPGLPRPVLRDLRRGRWVIQNHLDLHGLNRREAHRVVSEFLAASLAAGKRCLRIVHGRGHGSPGREGVLRLLLKSWLSRHQDVLAFCHAPPRDGGDGALWILLRAAGKTARQGRGG